MLEHHTELGAGYRIALKDLEMRGAGNLLGAEQSGFVHAVGFDLYLRMLEETVQRLMSGDAAPKLVPADVTIDTPNYLPDDYVVVAGRQDRRLQAARAVRAAAGDRGAAHRAARPVRPASAAGGSDARARPTADHWRRLGDRRNPGAWRRSPCYL